MLPRIELLSAKKLVGMSVLMSFSNDHTIALWKRFSTRIKEIKNKKYTDLYSVDIYNDPDFYDRFSPLKEFEKWAAIEVYEFSNIPDGMEALNIPSGKYAVFTYKGKPSDAHDTFHFVFDVWFPNSVYYLDNRPFFALMGDKYKGESPDSEEEFWFPIKDKVIEN